MITDNYIKMCEQAEEIQKQWRSPFRNRIGDWYWRGNKYLMIPDAVVRISDPFFDPTEDEIYIPTLEQLFDMVGNYKAQISRVFLSIMVMKKYKFDSIQELVINAVMEIKYHKLWTGEKWEEANE